MMEACCLRYRACTKKLCVEPGTGSGDGTQLKDSESPAEGVHSSEKKQTHGEQTSAIACNVHYNILNPLRFKPLDDRVGWWTLGRLKTRVPSLRGHRDAPGACVVLAGF
jgi:hypothetical protein